MHVTPPSPSTAATRLRNFAVIAVVLAIVALVAFYVARRPEPIETVTPQPMTQGPGPIEAPAPAMTETASPPMAPSPMPGASQAAQAQVMRERAMDLEQNFSEDPRDPAWAAATERTITQLIADIDRIDAKAYGVTAHEVECRSHGCMMSIDFTDEDLADEATSTIRRELVDTFNQSVIVPIRKSDGTIQYRMYSVTPGNAKLLRKRHPDMPAADSLLGGRGRN